MDDEISDVMYELECMLKAGASDVDVANALIQLDDGLTYQLKAQLGLVELLQPTVEK